MALQGGMEAGDICVIVPACAGFTPVLHVTTCVPASMPLARHILVTISESLYTVYIRSNDEVINGTG